MEQRIRIDLGKYKKGTIFTGRPQGYQVREDLHLDELDKDDNLIDFVIPSDTTSFNPSFFLGLLYESIKRLGLVKFKAKYRFDTSSVINKSEIEGNIQDALRNAANFIDPKSTLSIFG